MVNLIGRNKERQLLNKLCDEKRSHFIAIYGRRRIGKTYLIRNHFKNQINFSHIALANADMSAQLDNFYRSLHAAASYKMEKPHSWMDAFALLIAYLEKQESERKIVFLDELPWLDTPRSNFLSALEHFWNAWASNRDDVMLIICGSATSYIVKKLFNNKGGLHNRITQKIKLLPFTLSETELFLKEKGIVWDRYQISKAYMALGGVPFYLDALEKGKSIDQCIDQLFFDKNGLLYNEYFNLYGALFGREDKYLEVIKAIASKNKGLTRGEIVEKVSLESGGTLSKILEDLELSDFIRVYVPFGRKQRNSLYQLTDFYSLFYQKFISGQNVETGDWLNAVDNPKHRAWSGYAFEMLCLLHIHQIKDALGISGVQSNVSSWKSRSANQCTQIDLVIDRRDQVINLFEMKFSINKYSISKKYAGELRNKIGYFKAETKTRKAVFLSMLTTHGLEKNEYSGLVQNSLVLDDLF